jgi:hypothetical protein
VAYADDVTVVITNKQDIQVLHRVISIYEKATGAKINWGKSKGLLIGRWDRNLQLRGIKYTNVAKILGIIYGADIPATKIHQIEGSVQDYHTRKLDIQQRIWSCNTWYLSKLWYAAQVLPITTQHTQQITTILVRYLWKGWIFKVPITTLYKKRSEGGLGVIHIKAKCDTLYINRLQLQRHTSNSITACWITQYNDKLQRDNPPNWANIPPTIEYLRLYFQEQAYIRELQSYNSNRQHLRKLYGIQFHKHCTRTSHLEIRIQAKYPHVKWPKCGGILI